MRADLEGVGVGAGSFAQHRADYCAAQAAAGTNGATLFGFSDGALTADGLVGAYGWLVAVADGTGAVEARGSLGGGGKRGVEE